MGKKIMKDHPGVGAKAGIEEESGGADCEKDNFYPLFHCGGCSVGSAILSLFSARLDDVLRQAPK